MENGIRLNVSLIDSARRKRGWTWSRLAAVAGFSRVTGTKVKNGEPISAGVVNKLADVLEMRVARIVMSPPVKSAAGMPARGVSSDVSDGFEAAARKTENG